MRILVVAAASLDLECPRSVICLLGSNLKSSAKLPRPMIVSLPHFEGAKCLQMYGLISIKGVKTPPNPEPRASLRKAAYYLSH